MKGFYMKFEHQAYMLNMIKYENLYEKTVDGYRVQFVFKYHPITMKKKPCLVFMVNRTIRENEKTYLKHMINVPHKKICFESVAMKEDTLCIYPKINNRNIDAVMNRIFIVIRAFIALGIDPISTKTYEKYKESFDQDKQANQLATNAS